MSQSEGFKSYAAKFIYKVGSCRCEGTEKQYALRRKQEGEIGCIMQRKTSRRFVPRNEREFLTSHHMVRR